MLKYLTYEEFCKDESHSFIDKIKAITNRNEEINAKNQIDSICKKIYEAADTSIDRECKIEGLYNSKIIEHFQALGFSIIYNKIDNTYHIAWYDDGRPVKR